MEPYIFRTGSAPLLVSMPHAGTHVPDALAARMTPAALRLPDTDWHLPRLYDFLDRLGASMLIATHSRYVIDLNRPRDDSNLYPGQDTTALVPLDTFAKEPVYLPGLAPDRAETDARIARYWQPYHDRLAEELAGIQARHGSALLWDAHSIASQVPRFFSGKLTDFNLGTAGGMSCGAGLGEALREVASRNRQYSVALNGRFKGGHITRHYGAPATGVHAVQLELSWATYMDETHPYGFRDDLAAGARPVIRQLLETMLEWRARR